MGLSLTVLGCSGSYPGPGRACSGYLVQSGAATLWIDAGSGTLANLQRHTGLADVTAVVLTHEHPDHWTDITGFYIAAKYYLGIERVPVYAPRSVREHVYYSDEPIEWHVVTDGDEASVDGLSLRFSQTDHPPETLAVRVDDRASGRSLAYSADTGPAWSFERLGPGIDLALCEASFPKEHEGRTRHLSPRQAGAMAREAGVARLLLTHLQPGMDAGAFAAEAGEAFGGPVAVVVENERYEV